MKRLLRQSVCVMGLVWLCLVGMVGQSGAQGSWSSNPQPPASQAPAQSSGGVYSTQHSTASCVDCGRVSAITVSEKPGESDAVGLIAGGVAGAVLGRQIGAGRGKDMATIAGAVGGAYAGKKIQESLGAKKVWSVSVTYSDGRTASFDFDENPGLEVGDSVRSAGKSLVRN